MADGQVTCINKPDVNSSHAHITHLGNPANQWRWTCAHVIDSVDAVDAGTNTLYVIDPLGGARADIGVVREFGRAPYLRTCADREWNNNLLSLNQCPI